ncbi:MAG: serine/threonine-protein kinase [Planctomycetota bacterium]
MTARDTTPNDEPTLPFASPTHEQTHAEPDSQPDSQPDTKPDIEPGSGPDDDSTNDGSTMYEEPTAEVVQPTGPEAPADDPTGDVVKITDGAGNRAGDRAGNRAHHRARTRPMPRDASGGSVAAGAGATIGPYTLERKLGEGGFGVVYLAQQTEPVKRAVALKVIKRGMDTDSVVARFNAERQALAVMDHPGVAKVLDAGTTPDGLPFFVMEYVAGDGIARYADKAGLSIADRVGLLIQVCEAVQHAHQKGIVHRDLKPQNILVAEQDDRAAVRVIDFGIAKALDHKLTEQTFVTEEGLIIGTPEYMSPEQAGTAGIDIDTRTDVYALGVVLYELLTGHLPFDAKSLRSAGYYEIQRIIREVEPPRPSTRLSTLGEHNADSTEHDIAERRKTDPTRLRRTLRADLDWVVMKCLEKDRERRYATAAELAEELRRYLSDEPVNAGPPSVAYRTSKFVKRHKAGVAGGGLLAATVASAAIVSTVFWTREVAALEREQDARQSAERERAVAESVNDFLNDDLLGAPDPLADGPDVRVVDVLRRARTSIAERFEDQPAVRARVLGTLGEAFVNIGSNADAIPLLADARRQFQELDLEASPKARAVGLALGEALWRNDRFDEGLPIIESVLATWTEAEADDELHLLARLQYANALKYTGELDRAEQLYIVLADDHTRLFGADAASTHWVLYDLALVDVERGKAARDADNDADADRLLRSGLNQMRAAYEGLLAAAGPFDPRTITAASEVAAQLNRLNDFTEAEPLYRDTVAALRTRFGDDHFRTRLTLVNFGRLQQKQSKHTEAIDLLEEGLAGYRKDPGPVSADTVVITRFLAESYEAVGQPGGAIDLLERSYDECVQAGNERLARSNAARLAETHQRVGNTQAADRWRALAE